ncbi:MAG TPA: (Fe-S)-binding protein [Luteimonas sp.]|nr:(Fe-S)-binding protein [Luteimonas sp.]
MSEAVRRPAPAAPASAELVALTDQCVQCGLCLPACPTYRLDQLEAESPRGRIALARAWELGTIPPTATGDTHLDQCLGCRRCEVVCPAGVRYGPLLLQTRIRQRERRAPGWRQRGLEWLAARPRHLTRLLRLYRHLYWLLPVSLRPLPRPPATTEPTLPASQAGASVSLFTGCVARAYESGLRLALARLCAAAGVQLTIPDRQTCCGALHAHAGNATATAALAAANRAVFAGTGPVLTLASGCHEALAQALDGSAETIDALDFLATRADGLSFRATHTCIALHLPCTQRNVVKSDLATRALLARVPGLDIVELDGGPLQQGLGCCGAAGTQMLTAPERAAKFRQPLLDQLAASGATRLLSANIGCRLHFANGTRLPVQHPLEFLAECLGP